MDIDNRRAAITQIQTYLRYLSSCFPSIPRIAIDGIYGPETAAAVRAFQSLFHLEVTGEVNLVTWDTLLAAYREAQLKNANPLPLNVFPSAEYQVLPGDEGFVVSITQEMLRLLQGQYQNLPYVPLTGIYDEITQKAVTEIQRISNLEQTGILDKATWNVLVLLYESQ